MAKGKFKVQLRNHPDVGYPQYGNKRWLPVWASKNVLGCGYVMTRDEASDLYHELSDLYPDETYRIMECR